MPLKANMASVQVLSSSLLTSNNEQADFLLDEASILSTSSTNNSTSLTTTASTQLIDYDTSGTDLENIAFALVMLIVEGRTPTPVAITAAKSHLVAQQHKNATAASTAALVKYTAKENVHAIWEIERITSRILEIGSGQTGRSESPSGGCSKNGHGKSNRSTSAAHVCSKNNNQVR
jgi:hypothetical protein